MDRADVIILGGGLIGLALASALDSSGVSAVVVDPADPEQTADAAFDGRTSAVSSSSMRMLEAIGVADHLPEPGCPIRRISVADGLEPGGLQFEPDDDEPLGWMHENRHLRAALRARAESGRDAGSCGRRGSARSIAATTRVAMTLADGRKSRLPAGRRRRAQVADARGGGDPHRALEI